MTPSAAFGSGSIRGHREEQKHSHQRRSDNDRTLRSRAAGVVDRRARVGGGNGKRTGQPAHEVRGPERAQLAVRVDLVCVLLRERAHGRDQVGEGDERKCRRGKQQVEEVLRSDVGQPKGGQAPFHLPDDRDPVSFEIRNGSDDKSECEHNEGRRNGRKKPFDCQCGHQQARAQQHGRPVRLAELRDDLADDGEEVARADVDPQELAELGGDHDQRNPVDVPEKHGFAEEVGHEPQPKQARHKEQAAHCERQRRRERDVARRIDLTPDHRHRRHRHRGQRSQRGVRPDHVLPRGTEQPVDRQGKEGPVEPVDNRHPGQLGHRQRRGHCHRADRHPRHQVEAQEGPRVVHEGRQSGRHVGQAPRHERTRVGQKGRPRVGVPRGSSVGICHGRPAPGPTGATRPAARSSRGHSRSHAPSMTMTSRTNSCLIP